MRIRSWAFLSVILLAGCGGNGVSNQPRAVATISGSDVAGYQDGPAATALFSNPVNLVVAKDGTIYVADFDNWMIRKISHGQVSTLTKQTHFQNPFGIAISSKGDLYVGTDDDDSGTHNSTAGTVWKIDTTTGLATVVARDIGRPRGLAVLPNGKIVVSNLSRSTVQLLDPATGNLTLIAGKDGTPGFADNTGANAMFDRPYGCTVQKDGSILVADQNNNRIRKVTLGGVVTTFVGSATAGADNGSIATATLNGPQDVKVDAAGRVYIADTTGKLVRLVANGQVSTLAGDGTAGFQDGPLATSEFFGLEGFFVTPAGKVYVADGNGGDGSQPFNRIRVF